MTIEIVNLLVDGCEVYGGRCNGADPRSIKPGDVGFIGNPFRLGKGVSREQSIAKFKRYFWKRLNADGEFLEAVKFLDGKVVGCFCKPKACHLDVVKAWFDAGCPLK